MSATTIDKNIKARFDNKFDINIFNFQYVSGDMYKCSFSFIYSPEPKINRQYDVVVKRNQTITSAIEEKISKINNEY